MEKIDVKFRTIYLRQIYDIYFQIRYQLKQKYRSDR